MNDRSTTAPAPNLRRPSGATTAKLVAFLALVGSVSALNYLGNYAVTTSKQKTEEALFNYSTAVLATVVYGLILALVLWIASPWRAQLLALRPPRRWLRALGLAAATLLVAGIAIALIDSFLHGGREQGVVPKHFLHGHAGAYTANWLVVAGVAPFVEETTYRGLGYSLFFARWGVTVAIVATGLLFAASHGLLQAFPELAIFGFALAWLRSRTDSVFPGMLVHSAFNSFALASVFLH
ncbi:MAG TPA: type II CAAX endopeptidase family protein [Gaiellaceae bacterium]|nr:type II CAAX endopeptidase family protein [Gaiellaceae bacterium]